MNSATKSEFQWGRVVFFGRGISEYVAMFNLDLAAMRGLKVLDCGAGPAAFAVQAAEHGIDAIACDPLYGEELQSLRKMVDEDTQAVSEKQERMRELFHEELVPASERRKEMEQFLADFEKPESGHRYVAAELPSLPFADKSFDIVLCANLLFLYSDAAYGGMITESSPFDYVFHERAVEELMRVSRQDVRIYPLQATAADEHAFLRLLMKQLTAQGLECSLEPVAQRDIIGAEQMLRIRRR
jgi:hypothetical protein